MVLIGLITKWTSSTTNFMYKNKTWWRRKWWWDRVKKLKDRKSNGKNYILTILTRLGMFKSYKLPLKKKRGFKIFPLFSNLTFFLSLSLSHTCLHFLLLHSSWLFFLTLNLYFAPQQHYFLHCDVTMWQSSKLFAINLASVFCFSFCHR